jgi:3-oxoacyl-[acyl-carrier-protein] synthase-3
MSIEALNKLIVEFEIEKEIIDYLILCTQSPDFSIPATACIIQDKVGLKKTCGARGINLGCSGYRYGLGLAKELVSTVQAKNFVYYEYEVRKE